jgi:hypothetical protein
VQVSQNIFLHQSLYHFSPSRHQSPCFGGGFFSTQRCVHLLKSTCLGAFFALPKAGFSFSYFVLRTFFFAKQKCDF